MQKGKVQRIAEPNERLRYERQLRGWSQGRLAEQLEVPDYYISRWERGEVLPSPYYQQKLCVLFDKTAHELGLISASSQPAAPPEGQPVQPAPPVSPPSAPPAPWRRTALLLTLLLLVLLGIPLGVFLSGVPTRSASQAVAPAPIIGQLAFLSSGQTSLTSNQGIADGVELTPHPLAPPAPGKSYYAWLLPDAGQPEKSSILLGQFSVHAGTAHLVYHDPLHSNLLALTSRFLLTEEDASPPPLSPSIDPGTWRAQAALPDTRVDGPEGSALSFLDHLRHLLVAEPQLAARQLPGGVAIWLLRNTESLLGWATTARDAWLAAHKDSALIRAEAVRIISYLDGLPYAATDLPAGMRLPLLVDAQRGSIGLLQLSAFQKPPAYLVHVLLHLQGMNAAPTTTPAFRAQTLRIMAALDQVNAWLQQMRQAVRQLLIMSNEQLSQPEALTLLSTVVTAASAALSGTADSASGQPERGVRWVWQQVQALASMNITLISPAHPAAAWLVSSKVQDPLRPRNFSSYGSDLLSLHAVTAIADPPSFISLKEVVD